MVDKAGKKLQLHSIRNGEVNAMRFQLNGVEISKEKALTLITRNQYYAAMKDYEMGYKHIVWKTKEGRLQAFKEKLCKTNKK